MLIFGFGVKESLLATLTFICETCGHSGLHRLVKRVRRLSLFFIPVFSFGPRYADICSVCGRTIEVDRDQAEAAALQAGSGLR